MPQGAALEFKAGIALDEQLAVLMDAARPRVELRFCLERPPIFGLLENEDVGLPFPMGGVFFQVLRDDAVVVFRFHGHGSGDKTVEKMIDKILGLGVLPFVGPDG